MSDETAPRPFQLMPSAAPTPEPVPSENDVITRARQAERQRISRLLHDTVSQSLTGTYLQAVVLAQKSQNNGSEATGDLDRLVNMLHEVVLELRAITSHLSPGESDAPEASKNSRPPLDDAVPAGVTSTQ